MANEAEIINNPDSTPGAVSTGYQAQNTRMVAASVGCDNSVVEGGTGDCTLKLSGPVDVSGTLYTINTDVTFTLTTAGTYYIHLAGSGANLTPTIGTITANPHTFDPDKNARYTDTGTYRVLNWIIYYDGTTAYAHRIITPENEKTEIGDLDTFEETWITANGSWTAPRSKYYTIYVTGSGGDGAGYNYGGGGAAGATGIKRIWIEAGNVWTAAFSSVYTGYTTFTNGVTTLSARNGGNGVVSHGGQIYTGSSGFDSVIPGGCGHSGVYVDANNYMAGNGGASYYGGGGVGESRYSGGTVYGGESGYAYGSGGGSGSYTNGLGASGVIRIIG